VFTFVCELYFFTHRSTILITHVLTCTHTGYEYGYGHSYLGVYPCSCLGVAASLIEGQTCHSVAMISRKEGAPMAATKPKLQQAWWSVLYDITDEFSMLGKTFFPCTYVTESHNCQRTWRQFNRFILHPKCHTFQKSSSISPCHLLYSRSTLLSCTVSTQLDFESNRSGGVSRVLHGGHPQTIDSGHLSYMAWFPTSPMAWTCTRTSLRNAPMFDSFLPGEFFS
jgi:hypothetical protein